MVTTHYLWLYGNLYYGWDIFMCYNGHLYTSPADHRQGVVIPLGPSSCGLQQVTQTPSAAFPSVDLSPPLRLRRKKPSTAIGRRNHGSGRNNLCVGKCSVAVTPLSLGFMLDISGFTNLQLGGTTVVLSQST